MKYILPTFFILLLALAIQRTHKNYSLITNCTTPFLEKKEFVSIVTGEETSDKRREFCRENRININELKACLSEVEQQETLPYIYNAGYKLRQFFSIGEVNTDFLKREHNNLCTAFDNYQIN